jgi:DNA helicase HerA-like ATPase
MAAESTPKAQIQPKELGVRDIFRALNWDGLHIPSGVSVPNNIYQQMLDYMLERGYLNELPQREQFVNFRKLGLSKSRGITWLKVARLPISPNDANEYDLLPRWQSVLSALHSWGHRLIFLLRRKNGETGIYLGASASAQHAASSLAIEQFKEAASGGMPGIDLRPIQDPKELMDFAQDMAAYTKVGAVTGIPSFRKNERHGMLQTLDQLAFGIRCMDGRERDYALMVIADPVCDTEIASTISNFRRLGSEIHTDVNRTVSETDSRDRSKETGFGMGDVLMTVGSFFGLSAPARAVSLAMGLSKSVSERIGSTTGVTRQYYDKFAAYAEQVLDKHCERLNRGRSLGMWNAGIYVLGAFDGDIRTVMGMLRAVYSGDESYIEPIRTFVLNDSSGALDIAGSCDLIPLVSEKLPEDQLTRDWNSLGRMYQYLSTPLNTEELSIAISLPRRDVPGLRFVKTSVRFASNPAPVAGGTIRLGCVVDSGVVQNNEYRIDPNALVRHAIIAGSTGSGKSTTCKTLLREVMSLGIPALIVEPAKDDYVRWAMAFNKMIEADGSLSPEERERRRFRIYMPGTEGTERLKLNPFQPAAIDGAPIDMLTRCEQVISLFNATLPVSDVLPILIDESIYQYLRERIGEPFLSGAMERLGDYPKLDGVLDTARRVLASRGYDKKVQDDIRAALETRFSFLTRGKRGQILNVNRSTDYTDLFSRPAVINLSRLASAKDKALIMSLLMLSLYEYRVSAYANDPSYREKAQQNKLLHLTVIEEAHNLLSRPPLDAGGASAAQQAAADLFSNILSEIRGYGQGVMIIDQIPSRLIADAVKNTNYKIVHRITAPDDCAVMAAGMALREDQQRVIPALGVGDAIVCGDLDDAAAWVRLDK